MLMRLKRQSTLVFCRLWAAKFMQLDEDMNRQHGTTLRFLSEVSPQLSGANAPPFFCHSIFAEQAC
jgi:hypothetical protein